MGYPTCGAPSFVQFEQHKLHTIIINHYKNAASISMERMRNRASPFMLLCLLWLTSGIKAQASPVPHVSATTSMNIHSSTASSVRREARQSYTFNFDKDEGTFISGIPGYNNDVLSGVDFELPGVDVVLPGTIAVLPDDTPVLVGASAQLPDQFFNAPIASANRKDILQSSLSPEVSQQQQQQKPFITSRTGSKEDDPRWALQESVTLRKFSKNAFESKQTRTKEAGVTKAIKKGDQMKNQKESPTMELSSSASSPMPTSSPAPSPYPTISYKYHKRDPSSSRKKEKTTTPSGRRPSRPPATPAPAGDGYLIVDKLLKKQNKLKGNRSQKNNREAVKGEATKSSSIRHSDDDEGKLKGFRYKKLKGDASSYSSSLSLSKKEDKLERAPDGRDNQWMMDLWHQSNPPIYIPRPTSLPAIVPDVTMAPSVISEPPMMVPSGMPQTANRILPSFMLALVFQQLRLPTSTEVQAVVNLVSGYLGNVVRESVSSSTLTIVSLDDTNFRLGEPYKLTLNVSLENVPHDVATATIVPILQSALENEEAMLGILGRLPASNVFRTTSSVSYTLMERTRSATRSRVGVSMAAASGGVLVAMLGAAMMMWRQRGSSGSFDGDKAPVATICDETYGATTIAKSISDGISSFSDEHLSISSRSSYRWQPFRRSSEGTIDNIFGANDPCSLSEGGDDEESRQLDPLANPASDIQMTNDHDVDDDNDNLTIDSYVPVGVVDLIRFFSPAQ